MFLCLKVTHMQEKVSSETKTNNEISEILASKLNTEAV